MTNDMETFIVKVTDASGGDLFTGSFEAPTYHRALRIAWSNTTDDRPVGSAVVAEPRNHGPMHVPQHRRLPGDGSGQSTSPRLLELPYARRVARLGDGRHSGADG
jgi:hypothetical protein